MILEDYPEDAPSMRDTAGWEPQIALPPVATNGHALIDRVAAELAMVLPLWAIARDRFERTTVGLSQMKPEDWALYAARFLHGDIPESPHAGFSPALAMRYVADDLKALYAEAIQAVGPMVSPGQIDRWFWNATLAADLLRAVRFAALTSENNGFKTVGSRFIVPAPYVERAR